MKNERKEIRKGLVFGIVLGLVAMVFVGVPMNVSADGGTVILNPGYIQGTITVTGEEPCGGYIDAYSIPPGYDSRAGIYTGNYDMTVEGGYDYRIIPTAMWFEESPRYYAITRLGLDPQYNHVNVGETTNQDFNLDAGHVELSVNVIGGEIQHIYWRAQTNSDVTYGGYFITYKEEISMTYYPPSGGSIKYPLSGTTTMPVVPWETIDSDGDGNYEKYIRAWGIVRVAGIEYQLPYEYFSVAAGETAYVDWTLDVSPGTISGSLNFVNEQPTYVGMSGYATIDGNPVSFTRYVGDTYYVEVPPATWDMFPWAYWYYSTSQRQGHLSFASMAETVVINQGDNIVKNWNLELAYLQGTVDLWGANTDYENIRIDSRNTAAGSSGIESISTFRSETTDYEVVIHEGTWGIGSYLAIEFDYNPNVDGFYETSTLAIYGAGVHHGDPLVTAAAGETITGFNIPIGTAMITLKYEVEGGGELRAPRISTLCDQDYPPYRVRNSCTGYGSAEPTTLGECTVTVPAGNHRVQAHAYVEDGSFAKCTITSPILSL